MKTIDIKELKKIEFNMAKYLDQICSKNHLTYYIVGGTLLGAVRHKGFIPWDDDIDIAMPRKDFERLLIILENEGGPYKIQYYTNTPGYGYPFPKLVDTRTTLLDHKLGKGTEKSHVFIDIFLCDGMGNTYHSAVFRFMSLRVLRRMVFLSRRHFHMESIPKTVIFAIPWIICKIIGTKQINHAFNYLAAKRNFYNYYYVACTAGVYGKKEVLTRSTYIPTTRLSFEDTTFSALGGYHNYLTSLYGNYMQLPPKEKRTPNHTVEAWWNEQ